MALNTLLALFNHLNNQDIRYCHWKSNAHLDASFNGETDFDLLIAPEDQSRFTEILLEFGLKHRYSTANKVFPGMEDFIGFDAESGRLFHLHIHYKLVLGRKNQKNYRLPFEKEILENTIFHPHFPIKIIHPEIEYMILLIRSLIKIDYSLRSIARMILRRNLFPENIVHEYSYLLDQKKSTGGKLPDGVIPGQFNEFLVRFDKPPHKISVLRTLKNRRKLIDLLRPFRIFRNNTLQRETMINRLSAQETRSWLSPGGISFAFVGPDGSGKSSSAKIIFKWLSWKLSVEHIYMGLPKSDVYWEVLSFLKAGTAKIKFGLLARWFDIAGWLHIARQRLRKYNDSTFLINQGRLVIFDRYPLEAFWEMTESMDGPRIDGPASWREKEREIYRAIKHPDWIFLFVVEEDEAIRRKDEVWYPKKRDNLKEKIAFTKKLAAAKSPNVVVIDAMEDQDQVLKKIKDQIWKRI